MVLQMYVDIIALANNSVELQKKTFISIISYPGSRYLALVLDFIPIKKVELLPPFLPQIYHKLNLLMLWYFKSILAMHFFQTIKINGKKNR